MPPCWLSFGLANIKTSISYNKHFCGYITLHSCTSDHSGTLYLQLQNVKFLTFFSVSVRNSISVFLHFPKIGTFSYKIGKFENFEMVEKKKKTKIRPPSHSTVFFIIYKFSGFLLSHTIQFFCTHLSIHPQRPNRD